MKYCPYCGKEYPDNVTKCVIDNYLLPDVADSASSKGQIDLTAQRTEPNAGVEAPESVNNGPAYAAYPDYRWSARDGWKCLGMFLILGIVFALCTFMLDMHSNAFQTWRWSGFGRALPQRDSFMRRVVGDCHAYA